MPNALRCCCWVVLFILGGSGLLWAADGPTKVKTATPVTVKDVPAAVRKAILTLYPETTDGLQGELQGQVVYYFKVTTRAGKKALITLDKSGEVVGKMPE